MADYTGYDPFEYLSGRPKKKKTTTSTIGKIAPVTRPTNPFSPVSNAPQPSAQSQLPVNLLASLAQQKTQQAIPSVGISPNYDSDPILAKIRALGSQDISNAESEAARLRKQAVIESGVTTGNLGVDETTLQAARQNPASALAQFQHEAQQRERELEAALNSQGLFYSGYRSNQLEELARNRALGEAQIGQGLFGSLSEIDSQLGAARAAQVAREQEALEAAAERARQQAYQQSLMDSLAGAEQQLNAPPGYEDTVTGLIDPGAYEQAFGSPPNEFLTGGGTISAPIQPEGGMITGPNVPMPSIQQVGMGGELPQIQPFPGVPVIEDDWVRRNILAQLGYF